MTPGLSQTAPFAQHGDRHLKSQLSTAASLGNFTLNHVFVTLSAENVLVNNIPNIFGKTRLNHDAIESYNSCIDFLIIA